MEVQAKVSVKTSDQINEEPWIFLEKELQEFEKIIKELEAEGLFWIFAPFFEKVREFKNF